MPDSDALELYKQHQASQDKYTYFLLAAAAAAIAFALQKTDGLGFSWWLAPVGLAIVFWGASFYCGCKNIVWVQAAIYANFNLLLLRRGSHSEQPPPGAYTEAAVSGVKSALASNARAAQVHAKLQFVFLIAGAISFIVWRVVEMWRVTNAA